MAACLCMIFICSFIYFTYRIRYLIFIDNTDTSWRPVAVASTILTIPILRGALWLWRVQYWQYRYLWRWHRGALWLCRVQSPEPHLLVSCVPCFVVYFVYYKWLIGCAHPCALRILPVYKAGMLIVNSVLPVSQIDLLTGHQWATHLWIVPWTRKFISVPQLLSGTPSCSPVLQLHSGAPTAFWCPNCILVPNCILILQLLSGIPTELWNPNCNLEPQMLSGTPTVFWNPSCILVPQMLFGTPTALW